MHRRQQVNVGSQEVNLLVGLRQAHVVSGHGFQQNKLGVYR